MDASSSGAHALKTHPKQKPTAHVPNSDTEQLHCTNVGCNFSTLDPRKLRIHVRRMHQPRACAECGVMVKRYKMKEHLQTHSGVARPQVPCPIAGCGQSFLTEQGLRGHVLRHSPPKLACTHPGCPKLFYTTSELTKHAIQCHGGGLKKTHMCAECGATFAKRSWLDAHAQTHNQGRPFTCDYDGCFFATKTHRGLANHKMYVHQATPTQCPECGKMLKGGMQKHMQRVHGSAEAARFECNSCGRGFPTAWHLRQHVLQHENARHLECDLCKKRFNILRALKMHLVASHLTLKLKCDECGDLFKSKLALKCHKMRHTGERPFQCPYCDATFRHQPTFDRHRRRIHKEQYALEKIRPYVRDS